MPVVKELTQGIDKSSFTHTNPFVETVQNERQPIKTSQYSSNGITYRDEWIGTSEEINALLSSFIGDNPYTYSYDDGESYQIDRQKGDLSKLTRIYTHNFEDFSTEPSDSVNKSVGITPWAIRSETTEIGPIEYYICKHQLTKTDCKDIKRDRLALWDVSPLEYKNQYLYKTVTKGWQTLDKSPDGTVDSAITLAIAQWISTQERQSFPLTTVRITHEEIINGDGTTMLSGKVNTKSLEEDSKRSITNISGLQFPSNEFGKELSEVPDCPFEFTHSYPTKFTLADWNVRVYDEAGRYLVTKEYISYPEVFPNPIDPTPGD